MAARSREWKVGMLAELEGRQAVLAVISASPSITIEALLHQLPWMQWGDLFSILGECLQEGLVILSQKDFQFEIQAIQFSQRGRKEDVQEGMDSSPLGDRMVII